MYICIRVLLSVPEDLAQESRGNENQWKKMKEYTSSVLEKAVFTPIL